jgi:predicted nuclease of predicted toxin-antitoxin system
MVCLYADEQFPSPVVEFLRLLEHDFLTLQTAGKSGQKIPDLEVLDFATEENRSVVTLNRSDFIQLHKIRPHHAGIIVCSDDRNWEALANRIDRAVEIEESLINRLIRVNRPQ